MPLNTSTSNPIPWLNLEPPTASLARGAAVGAQIAASRARNQAMRQDAEQFAVRSQQQDRQLAIAEEENKQRVALASRRFAAQQAYQAAVTRDLTQAAEEAAAHGGDLDDETATKIAAKHFLRYGPSMGEGYGSTFSAILQAPRRARQDELADQRLELEEKRLKQGDQRVTQGDTRLQSQALRDEADRLEKGQTLQPGPTGQPQVIQGPKPPTSATVTVNQEALSSALGGLRQAAKLRPLINSGTFGPKAFIEGKLIDGFLANQFPELLNKDRVASSVLVAQLRGATARAIRSDSNITKDEQENIFKTIPNTDEFFTSPAKAIVQLDTINQGIVERAIRAARNLKQPVPDELVPYVPKDLLQPLAREKLMTPAQGQEWYRQNRK